MNAAEVGALVETIWREAGESTEVQFDARVAWERVGAVVLEALRVTALWSGDPHKHELTEYGLAVLERAAKGGQP